MAQGHLPAFKLLCRELGGLYLLVDGWEKDTSTGETYGHLQVLPHKKGQGRKVPKGLLERVESPSKIPKLHCM